MKAKLYYQAFELNYECYDKLGLIVNELDSFFIKEFMSNEFDLFSSTPPDRMKRTEIVDLIWHVMNLYPNQVMDEEYNHRFIEAGHTSMSVGDYIEFSDGEIWVAGRVGWEVRK